MVKSNVVKLLGGDYVWIDTRYTSDCGWETMVFECDEDGKVKSWIDLDCENYFSEASASQGHDDMVEKWENRWSI